MKFWAIILMSLSLFAFVGCDKDDGGGAPAVTPYYPNQHCYNGYGYNNGYGYGQNGYLNTCTPAEIAQGYRIVNGIRVNCHNSGNLGYNGSCYNNGFTNRSCTQQEQLQGYWIDQFGHRRSCHNNFLNNGFVAGNNYDYSQATQICQQAYGANYYAVVFNSIGTIKCVSGFTMTSLYSYNGFNWGSMNPYFYGGYQNVYQACRVGHSYNNNCNCGNIGGTLGWVSAGVQWGICL